MPLLPAASAASAAATAQGEHRISALLQHAGYEVHVPAAQLALIAEHPLGQFIANHVTVGDNYLDPQLVALHDELSKGGSSSSGRRSLHPPRGRSTTGGRSTTSSRPDDDDDGAASHSGDDDDSDWTDQDYASLAADAAATGAPQESLDTLRARLADKERRNARLQPQLPRLRATLAAVAAAATASRQETHLRGGAGAGLRSRRDALFAQLGADGRGVDRNLDALALGIEDLSSLLGTPEGWLLVAASQDAYGQANSRLDQELRRALDLQKPRPTPSGGGGGGAPPSASGPHPTTGSTAAGELPSATSSRPPPPASHRLVNPFLPEDPREGGGSGGGGGEAEGGGERMELSAQLIRELQLQRLTFRLSEEEAMRAEQDLAGAKGRLLAVQQLLLESPHQAAIQQRPADQQRRLAQCQELQAEIHRRTAEEVMPALEDLARLQDVTVLQGLYELRAQRLKRDCDRMQDVLDALLDQRARHSLLTELRQGEDRQLHGLYDMLEGVRWKLDEAAKAATARCARCDGGGGAAAAAAAEPLVAQLAAACGGGAAAAAPYIAQPNAAAAAAAAAAAVAVRVMSSVDHSLDAASSEMEDLTGVAVPAAVAASGAALDAARALLAAPPPASSDQAPAPAAVSSSSSSPSVSSWTLSLSLPGLREALSELTAASNDLNHHGSEPLVNQFHAYKEVMAARREEADAEHGVLAAFWTAPHTLSQRATQAAARLEALRT